MITYTGLLAPEEQLTNDRRMFAAGKGKWRDGVPVMLKDRSGGHGDAVVVGRVKGMPYPGPGGMWGKVEFLDPAVVPEVTKAAYLLDQKVVGPSVDLSPEYTVEAVPHPGRPNEKAARFTDYTVVGVTLVPMPAFSQVHLSADTENERALLASAGVELDNVTYFDINHRAWDSWPLAPRDYVYDADNAVKRIAGWSGIGTKTPSLEHYASAFLWRDGNQTGDSLAQDSFRMPLCDIIDGQPHLVYHAVYAAAALLSGGHGGLPNIPQADQEAAKGVINQIYQKMAQTYGDSGMKSPFDPNYTNRRPESQPGMAMETEFAATEPYGDVEYADPGYRDGKKRYPIDTPDHIRAAWSYINQEKNAAFYDAKQLAAIKSRIKAAAAKAGIQIAEQQGMALLAGIGAVRPPRKAFENPRLSGPTRLTIGEDGHVFGHLATWKQCHIGVGNACVIAPKSRTNYSYFRLGPVICDDGSEVMAGKITVGTGHANDKWGVMPARDHYDNTAWAAAVVNVGEDKHGIWVSGVLTPSADENMVATLRRSPLSGDWRRVDGNLELIAALAVNSPGFPIVSYQDGGTFSMQSIGVVEETDVPEAEYEPVEEVPSFGIEPDGEDTWLPDLIDRLDYIEEMHRENQISRRLFQLDQLEAKRQQQAMPQGAPAQADQSAGAARQMAAKLTVLPEPGGDKDKETPEEETNQPAEQAEGEMPMEQAPMKQAPMAGAKKQMPAKKNTTY